MTSIILSTLAALLKLSLILYGGLATGAAVLALVLVPLASVRAYGWRYALPAVASVLSWWLRFWIGLAAELASIVLNPFVTLFADHRSGRLPAAFSWMETWDAVLPGFPPEQGFTDPYPSSWLAWYWQSVRWLWRNRAYRLTTMVIGAQTWPSARNWSYQGQLDTIVTDEQPESGFLGVYCDSEGRISWEMGYGKAMAGNRKLDFRAGYKLRGAWGEKGNAQHVVRLRPFVSR